MLTDKEKAYLIKLLHDDMKEIKEDIQGGSEAAKNDFEIVNSIINKIA